ncbi:oxidoreductase [Bradyrhizobium sp. CCBAU 53338]|nr:oxidoreductase [Bradyrhizobium sp. CCBAU 53338]
MSNLERLKLVVVRTKQEAPLVRSLLLESATGCPLPIWAPGAHIKVFLPDGQERCYSLVELTAPPAENTAPLSYLLGVRLDDAGQGGSRYMHSLNDGDMLEVSAPQNHFPLSTTDSPIHLIAGGIGITPLASMAAHLVATRKPFLLRYAVRSQDQLAFLADLRTLAGPNLRLHVDDRDGVFPLGDVMRSLPADEPLYLCGPRVMIDSAISLARELQWSEGRLRFESFSAAPPAAGDQPFEVVLMTSGRVLQIPKDRTILDVMIEQGIDALHDCKRGDCGICQAAVLEGVPDHRDYVLSEQERASGKLMQICVSRAKSRRLVLDL